MGRWASISFSLSSTKKLRIISAYQVCNQNRPGANTAYAHQHAQLIIESNLANEPNQMLPRQAFVRDLQNFIRQIQTAGDMIILAGDFNDDITETTSGMNQLATTCGLIDLFSFRLGSSTSPSTYQRGSKRLDYILISPELLPSVQAAGYDPFGYRLPSDHRGMFLDLRTDHIFEHIPQDIVANQRRDFRTSTPGVIKAYVNAKIAYLQAHKFFERMSALAALSHPNHVLAESLDRDFQRASHHAARVCSKKPKPPWSLQLAEAWAELHYYRLLESASKTTANYLPAIMKLQHQWPSLPNSVSYDPATIQQGKKTALDKFKHIRQQAQLHRDAYLLDRQAYYLSIDDKASAKIVHRIIRAESQHKVFTKIKYLRNQDNGNFTLSALKIPRTVPVHDLEQVKTLPDTPDHWETITVPAEIESILIQRNQHHFSQAEGTPFTSPPLCAEIGYKADGYAADLILTGRYNRQNLPPATSLLIQHLQKKTLNTLEGQITMEDVLGKLRTWKESTTTSPSGTHLGHYHCMWRDPKLPPDDPSRDKILEDQKRLLKATVGLMNYALRFGYTYERWTKIVNVMLQKDPGNPRIHRLRVIHLYEADYNLLLAVKWRQALHHSEDHNLLNNGLYGSRPGRSAHDPAFLEVLQHETYRMSMKTGINFDLDASSCYDRILANLAMIASRRVGLAPEVALVNASTLEKAQYYLKTRLGTSNTCYSHNTVQPIHGTGQGSGNSPTIWCFLCSALFDAFESKAHGATFVDYQATTTLPMSIVGFVDDCTQRVNKFTTQPQPSPQELLAIMQSDTQLWNDLLWSSGGALEQSKCSFHLIQSDWNNNGHPFLKGGIEPTTLELFHHQRPTTIQQKSNYEAHKTLGCYINPAFTRSQPWKTMTRKNETFAQLLETNFFSRSEAWTFYTSIYLPAITYPLPITPLTQEQCNALDSRFLRSLIPRCGYNRNMSRAVRYGPYRMGGAGFKPLYSIQGALMLQQVQKYFNSPTSAIGKMLWIATSWTQAFLGTSKFFLSHVHEPLPPIGPSFLLDLRYFLHQIDGAIYLHEPPVPQNLRRNDRCIMDIVLQQNCWNRVHQTQINACRRFCQAQTLADITNMLGTRILQWSYDGDAVSEHRPLRISAFNQKRPGDRAWKTWRRFLKTISNSYGVLYSPLGEWTTDVSRLRAWPPNVYDPVSDMFFTHSTEGNYHPHHRLWRQCFSIQPTTELTRPQGFPTALVITMDTLRPVCNFLLPPTSTAEYSLPSSNILPRVEVPSWEWELLKATISCATDQAIRHIIQAGRLITCSDGSATSSAGTFGFAVSSLTGQRLAQGSGQSPGSFPNSFRSEAYGILATMRWLYHFLRKCNPTVPISVTHYLDNKSVIQRVQRRLESKSPTPNRFLLSEHDVIEEIVMTVRQIDATVEFQWVKGHQNLSQPYETLQLPAKLNCDADFLASRAMVDPLMIHQIPPLPHTPSQLIIQGKTITHHIKRQAVDASTIPKLMRYLQSKFHWTDQVVEMIDWDNYQKIILKYRNQWSTIVKHLHACSPTGKIAHRNDPYLPHECPACSAPYESNEHVILCSHPSRKQWRQETVQKVHAYQEAFVDPYLLDILRDGITRYHRQAPPLEPSDYPDKYGELINSQNAVGWGQLYRGKWSTAWSSMQDQFKEDSPAAGPKINGSSWIIGLGRLVLDQWLLLWKIRNNERHGIEQMRHSQLRERRVHAELHDLYQYRLRVCPNDRVLFYPSPHQHILAHPSLDTLEDWILTNRTAILSSAALASQHGITTNYTIHDFPTFNPILQAVEHASLPAGAPPS